MYASNFEGKSTCSIFGAQASPRHRSQAHSKQFACKVLEEELLLQFRFKTRLFVKAGHEYSISRSKAYQLSRSGSIYKVRDFSKNNRNRTKVI